MNKHEVLIAIPPRMKIFGFLAPLIFLAFLACTPFQQKKAEPQGDSTGFNLGGNNMAVEDRVINDNKNLQLLYISRSETTNSITAFLAGPKHEKLKYFYSDTLNFVLAKQYALTDGGMKLVRTDTLEKTDWSYLEIDSATIGETVLNEEKYFYYESRQSFMGQAVLEQLATFNLFDLKNFRVHTLAYEGVPADDQLEELEGKFLSDSHLKAFTTIKKYLYGRAFMSRYIYHPKGKQKDITYYTNYARKWNVDNQADNQLANGHGSIPDTIYSTYYKEPLFSAADIDEFSKRIENDKYTVVSFFRGNIVAYNKQNSKYFPVYIESCITGCDKDIKFVGSAILSVEFTEDSRERPTQIDLGKIRFTD